MELFTQLEHAPEYDGSPKGKLVAWIGESKYSQEETPAMIGLNGGMYLIVFKPSKSCCCH